MMKLPKIKIPPTLLRLNLTVVCEVVLLLAVSLGIMLYFSRQTLKQEAIHDAEQALEVTVQNIDNILLSIEQTTDNIYHDLQMHLDQPERMETYCRKMMECNPYIAGCAIAFDPDYYKGQGQTMVYVRRDAMSMVTTKPMGDKPYTAHEWYTEPMKTGRACWTDPNKPDDLDGDALTTFCMPIFPLSADGKVAKDTESIGVIAVDLSVSLLSQVIPEAKSSPHSYCILLGSNGSFIIHPDADKLSRQTVLTHIDKEADPALHKAASAMMNGETGHKSYKLNGEKWYVFYQPFSRYQISQHEIARLNWSVGEICPNEDILGAFYHLRWVVLAITLAALALFFLITRAVIHKQMHPLRMLTTFAKYVTDGDFTEIVPRSDRDDEVGQLQNNFRVMQQSLNARIKELRRLKASLETQGMVLQKASGQTFETDRVKSAFLHYITSQMITPGDIVDRSVTNLCNNYRTYTLEDIDREMNHIKEQSAVILELLEHIVKAVQIENDKEDSHV